MNEASTKLSSSPSSPRASKSSQSAHKMPSRTPDCTPCWKRRWQVEDGPYRRRQILPGSARTQDPQHPIENPSGVAPAAAASIGPLSLFLLPLHQEPDVFPLRICEISHTLYLFQLRSESNCLFRSYVGEIGSRGQSPMVRG